MNDLRLWYKKPAEGFTGALPFGNGSLGGMFYGGVPKGKITLNDDTLWSGARRRDEPKVTKEVLDKARSLAFSGEYEEAEVLVKREMLGFFNESYLPMSTLNYNYNGIESVDAYERALDLNEGILTTSFISDETNYSSSLFSSYPDKQVILRFTADGKNQLEMHFTFTSLLRSKTESYDNKLMITGLAPTHVEPNYVESDNPIVYDDSDLGMQFVSSLVISETDGRVEVSGEGLCVSEATYIVVNIASANGFRGYDQPLCHDLEAIVEASQLHFTSKPYEQLLEAHLRDYKGLFSRVNFTLNGEMNMAIPTDERLKRLKESNDAQSRDLEMYPLYFQYGRYLMIASSRPGSQASNLQGLWNEELRAAWSSNYTVNINTQMNYWMTNGANLIECAEPLIKMVEELSVQGQITAEEQFHCRGWVTAHNVDLWRQTGPVGGFPKYAYWPMGGVWLTAHLVKQYFYTLDDRYLLETVYPVVKGSALFCSDWLVEGPDNRLHTCPSTTAENTFVTNTGAECGISYSSTMDIALIREVFTNYIMIAEKFAVDEVFVLKVKDQLSRLPQPAIGEDQCLMEWIKPFEEYSKGHRHFSPLYGLHPGKSINEYETPTLIEACANLIEKRLSNGGGHTGWSCAWLISLYARLGDGEKANEYLTHLFTHSSYDNLFDLHPPLGEGFAGEKEVFQIDGNFGGVEGMLNMLLQSHLGEIYLLPALPKSWAQGDISGLLAEGGVQVSIKWNESVLVKATLKVKQTRQLKIKYKHPITIKANNAIIDYTFDQNHNYTFSAMEGQTYEITLL